MALERLTDPYNYRAGFSCILGTEFRKERLHRSKLEIYDRIEELCLSCYKRIFIPPKNLDPQLNDREMNEIVFGFVFPLTRAVLIDAEENSRENKAIFGVAIKNKISGLYFFPKYFRPSNRLYRPGAFQEVQYSNAEELIEKLSKRIKF